MKQWFPLTDYDFYAYLTAGAVCLAGWDIAFNDAVGLGRTNWTIIQGILLVAASYVLGSLVAGFSSVIIEHGITHCLFYPPTVVQLGYSPPRRVERCLSALAAPRELSLLPLNVRASLESLDPREGSPRERSEQVFFSSHARAITDTAAKARLESFQNQYGMFRNLCLSFFIVSAMTVAAHTRAGLSWWYPAVFGGLCVLLYLRFLKFYAAFSREVFRTEYRLAKGSA